MEKLRNKRANQDKLNLSVEKNKGNYRHKEKSMVDRTMQNKKDF